MLTTRKATKKDLPAIVWVYSECLDRSRSSEFGGHSLDGTWQFFERMIAAQDDASQPLKSVVLVVCDNEEVVGVAHFGLIPMLAVPNAVQAQESVFWVHSSAGGKGAGSNLLQACEDWARDNGASLAVIGYMETHAEHSAEWYRRKGYSPYERYVYKNLER